MDLMKTRQMLKNGKSIYDLPLRVAYYARVSSDKDIQLNSLDNQITYYDDRIKTNNNWKFAGGYVDEGLSGSSVKKRDDFNRMIADGERGLFDLVITKEISRFARDTLDSIQYNGGYFLQGLVYFLNRTIFARWTRIQNCALQLWHPLPKMKCGGFLTVLSLAWDRRLGWAKLWDRITFTGTIRKMAS